MELRRLRLLAELGRRGTIAAVAQSLAYSPSSVSVQLAELQREAGTPLTRRTGRTLALTAAGWRLVRYADEALAADEAIRAELAAMSEEPTGRIVMAFVQTAALALLPEVMGTLNRTAPRLRVELVHRETALALEELHARSLDHVIGIDYDPVPPPQYAGIIRQDLLREDVLLAVPAHSHLSDLDAVPVAALEHSVWAAGAAGGGHSAVTEYLCSRLGAFTPDIRHRTDDALILQALVSSGHAVALLPALIGTATPDVATRPLVEGRLQRTVFTATRTSVKDSPSTVAVRAALASAARHAAADRNDVRLLATS